MAHTLASIRDQVEINLSDSTNLIWTTTVLDEAIRAALLDISRVYDTLKYLKDLDGAASTTVSDLDAYILVKGAAAHALVFRVVDRYEMATPEPTITPDLAILAEARMAEFKGYLTQMDLAARDLVEYQRLLDMIQDEQDFITAENALDRAADLSLQDDQQSWATSENALDRALKADLQDDQQTWKTSENALDRDLKLDILQAKYTREDALTAIEQARLDGLQSSTDTPYSQWEWEEEDSF